MSLFGQPTQTSSLFGAPASTSPASGTSLFGAPASTTPTSGGSLFGAPASTTPASGTSLFGAPTTNTPSLFGSTPTANAPTTSLFGGGSTPTANPSGGSLFGTTPSTTSTAGTSLFGQPTGTQSTGLFGGTSGGSLFGTAPTTTTTGGSSLFGQQPSNQPTSSLFLPSNTSGASLFGLQQQPQQAQQPKIIERLTDLMYSTDPNNQNSKFLFWFYNYSPNINIRAVPKPANVTQEQWEQAIINCPDPNMYIPIPIKSFEELKARKETQEKTLKEMKEKSRETLELMREVQMYLNQNIGDQLAAMKKKQTDLLHRYIEVWCNLESYRASGVPISFAEDQMSRKIKFLHSELNQLNSVGAKVDEMSNQMRLTNLESENLKFDPTTLASLYNVFKQMNQSIDTMATDLELANKDMEVLKNELFALQKYRLSQNTGYNENQMN